MNVLMRIIVVSAVTLTLASTSFNAFAGKIERGTVLADEYNRQLYGDREYQFYHKDQPKPSPGSTRHYKKAIRYFEEGKFDLAEFTFKRSMRGSMNFEQANAYLGLVNIEQNQHKSAVRYLKRAVKENPDWHSLKAVLGLSYVEIGKEEKASFILAQLKEQKTDFPEQTPKSCVLNESIDQLEKALAVDSHT